MTPVPPATGAPPSLPPLYLAGPTASGKSVVALLLARELNGEIISVDSMQVYRGLDIGTAKPTAAERATVPHHLIDVADLHESFDAARFVELARQAEGEIQARGRVPIYCGGTGLYFKALLDGLGAAPPGDASVRAKLEARPLADLLLELAAKDPVTFARIDRQNPRRVVRALEVIQLTGLPFSSQRADWGASGGAVTMARFFMLERDQEELKRRIDERVEGMFRAGLVAEVEQLRRQGLGDNRTALQAIGYRQVMEHLAGERSLADTIALVKQKTRQFAKRQLTWFHHQSPARGMPVPPGEPDARVAERVRAAATG